MAVRGTTSFVYFTDQSLGSGATGNVYFGRHKRKGTPCAVKSFRGEAGTKELQMREREFEVMRRLNHENVVKFISIEPESQGKEFVLIMELCTGGSLFKILEEPENAFGFEEEEFLVFLRDITQALQYMRREKIVHRDIKPGNILRHVKDDSGSVYKLTDFGAARELQHGDDEFMSICGTEEYLHPAVYERALLAGPKGRFNASIDLWSLGVTIFHVATGHLPFQAHGGRRNREDMYRIISEKGPGVISGIQRQKDSEITWSRDLPATCGLSRGLKKHLVPMLARLLESDSRRQCTFDEFFYASDDVTSRPVLHIFCLSNCLQDRLYIGADERFSEAHLRDALAELTELPDAQHSYIHEHLQLSDLLRLDVASRPITFADTPFYVVPRGVASVNDVWNRAVSNAIAYPETVISSSSSASSSGSSGASNLYEDVAAARTACAYAINMTRQVDQLNRVQAHILKSVTLLHRSLSCSSLEMQSSLQTLLFVIQSLMEIATDKSVIAKLQEKRLQLSSIVSLVLKTTPHASFIRTANICQRNLCRKTMKKCVTELRQINENFKEQRKKVLTYNDEQIHKFDRLRITEIVKRATAHYNRCSKITDQLLKQFHDWFCVYSKEQDSFDRDDTVDVFQAQIKNFLSKLQQVRPKSSSANDISCQTIGVEELNISVDQIKSISMRPSSSEVPGIIWRDMPHSAESGDQAANSQTDAKLSYISRQLDGISNWSEFSRNAHFSNNAEGRERFENSFDSAYNSRPQKVEPCRSEGNRYAASDVIKLREDNFASSGQTIELRSRGIGDNPVSIQTDNLGNNLRRQRDRSSFGIEQAPGSVAMERRLDIRQQLRVLNLILGENEKLLSSAQSETQSIGFILERLFNHPPNNDRNE